MHGFIISQFVPLPKSDTYVINLLANFPAYNSVLFVVPDEGVVDVIVGVASSVQLNEQSPRQAEGTLFTVTTTWGCDSTVLTISPGMGSSNMWPSSSVFVSASTFSPVKFVVFV